MSTQGDDEIRVGEDTPAPYLSGEPSPTDRLTLYLFNESVKRRRQESDETPADRVGNKIANSIVNGGN